MLFVPDQLADIELILEQPGLGQRMSANSGVAPRTTAGTGNLFGIKIMRDRARRFAAGKRVEDAPHDYCLGLVDAAAAVHGLTARVQFPNYVVAIAKTTA